MKESLGYVYSFIRNEFLIYLRKSLKLYIKERKIRNCPLNKEQKELIKDFISHLFLQKRG